MAAYLQYGFARSDNSCKPALCLERGVDWNPYPSLRDWLQRIHGEPRRRHPIPKRA